MVLENKKIKIRTAVDSDSDELLTWWNDGKIMEHAGFPYGLKMTKEKVLENINNQSDERKLLVIEFDNTLIGEMNYKLLSEDVSEIGIKICDFNKQNQGIGSQCLCLLINYLFKDINIKKIILDTNLKNKRAQRVYEKLGFKKVKIDIDSWKNQMGELQSVVYYELSKEDWNVINE